MLEIKGYNIDEFPYQRIKKVSDLVYFDGPILSHFKDMEGNNFLHLWIDKNESYNRWIVFKISEDNLFLYLTGEKSLKDLLIDSDSDFITLVDIDNDLNYHNTKLVSLDDLSSEYLPENDSYYNINYSDQYELFIKSKGSSNYARILRDSAIYFKLEPSETKYPGTYPVNEISSFLT